MEEKTMWTVGKIDGFDFEVKHFEEGSGFGIDEGRISKLFLSKAGKIYVSYERGWEVRPTRKRAKCAYEKLLKKFNWENIVTVLEGAVARYNEILMAAEMAVFFIGVITDDA